MSIAHRSCDESTQLPSHTAARWCFMTARLPVPSAHRLCPHSLHTTDPAASPSAVFMMRRMRTLLLLASAVSLLSLACPRVVSGALSNGPSGHVLSSSLQVFGNVSVVDGSGGVNNLLDLIQRQQAVIASQSATLARLASTLPSLVLAGVPTSSIAADTQQHLLTWASSSIETSSDGGASYNPTTGVYRVPATALYAITATLCVHATSAVTVFLYVDGLLVRYAISEPPTSGSSVTLTTHMRLNAGSQLTLNQQVNAGGVTPSFCADPHGHVLSIAAVQLL